LKGKLSEEVGVFRAARLEAAAARRARYPTYFRVSGYLFGNQLALANCSKAARARARSARTRAQRAQARAPPALLRTCT
jgi:hypothetical protein